MFSSAWIPTLSSYVSFMSLIQEYSWLFIPAFIVLLLSLGLRCIKIFAVQVLLLVGFFIAWNFASGAAFILLTVLQIGLAVWTAVRLVTEIEWSYARRLEKTHFLARDITKGGNAGIRKYRF